MAVGVSVSARSFAEVPHGTPFVRTELLRLAVDDFHLPGNQLFGDVDILHRDVFDARVGFESGRGE
ncbi:hypothetical protein D1872_308630 [compost metagenome]